MNVTEFPPLKMTDVSGGQMSAVEDGLIPDNACRLTLNFRYDKIGKAVQRLGYTRLGAAVSSNNTCDGLTGFVNSSGSVTRDVAAYNGTNYAYDGSSWTGIGGAMVAGTKVRYASFIDLVFRVGGGAATKSWNGNTGLSFGSSQLTGAPDGSLIVVYKSRVHIAGDSSFPDRLYFSTIPDVSGNISWDTSLQYLDVNPADGDNITALMRTGTLMLIFKRNFIYRWNGTSTDADPVINVGTISQETVANVNGTVFFFNPRGIFATDGGTPVEMSRPVKDFVDAIPASNYDSMCAYSDGERFGLFCGTVTVAGRTYTNLVLEYDTNTQVWQPHTLAHPFTVFANCRTSAGADFVAGGRTTYVETMFSGNTDDGTAIDFERETRKMEFDGRFSEKEVNDGMFFLSGCPGAIFTAIPEGQEPVKLGTAQDAVTLFRSKAVRGKRISFKISGSNVNAPAEWTGFYILKARSLGLISKT